MFFTFNLYSSLLLIFFFHILVYAFMLWWRGVRAESTADKILGTFLVVAALMVVPWMTGFAGWYNSENSFYKEILFYTPFVHSLLLGPLLFLYVKGITNISFRIKGKDWWHFAPGFLYIIWTVIVVVVDKMILKRYYLMNGQNDPDFDSWYQVVSAISIVFYLVLSIRYYRQYRTYAFFELSFVEAANLAWLRNFLFAFGLITILPFVQEVLELIPSFKALYYVADWYYFLAFAIVVYYIAINGYNASSIPLHRLFFEPSLLLQYHPIKALSAPVAAEDASFEVIVPAKEEVVIDNWKIKVADYVEKQEMYLETELTLTELARKLSTNTSLLSKVINQGFGLSFNDYINQFRVEAMVRKLKEGEHHRQTLLGIAFDCGFNSKATFNRAFKKQTGLSPKEWIERNTK